MSAGKAKPPRFNSTRGWNHYQKELELYCSFTDVPVEQLLRYIVYTFSDDMVLKERARARMDEVGDMELSPGRESSLTRLRTWGELMRSDLSRHDAYAKTRIIDALAKKRSGESSRKCLALGGKMDVFVDESELNSFSYEKTQCSMNMWTPAFRSGDGWVDNRNNEVKFFNSLKDPNSSTV